MRRRQSSRYRSAEKGLQNETLRQSRLAAIPYADPNVFLPATSHRLIDSIACNDLLVLRRPIGLGRLRRGRRPPTGMAS